VHQNHPKGLKYIDELLWSFQGSRISNMLGVGTFADAAGPKRIFSEP
jgi:hypothetical protein